MTIRRAQTFLANFDLGDKPMVLEGLRVPRVELWESDRSIGWQHGTKNVYPNSKLLLEFAGLAEAEAGAILNFAGRWGALELCYEHLQPASYCGCQVFSVKPEPETVWFLEPLSGWRHYAAIARSLLSVAHCLNQRTAIKEDDWQVIGQLAGIGGSDFFRRGDSRRDAWRRLEVALNVWLSLGGVRIVLHRASTNWNVGLGGRPAIGNWLFGAIGVQLMLAITNTDGVAFCSGCGKFFLPSRRPNPKRRRYCEECKKRKMPGRDAARDYRARGLS